MPIVPPRTLQTLLTGDTATSRVMQNVKTAVDPVLSLMNTTFAVANDGALSFLRRIRTFAADNISGTLGKFTTVNAITVNASAVNSTAVSSAYGFKSQQDMGVVWISNAAASTRYQAKRFTQNNEASNTFNAPTLFQPLYAGSIMGIHVYSQGTAGGTFQCQLYKSATVINSGTAIYLQTGTAPAGQYYGTGFLFAKGAYPFVNLDYFSAGCTFSTAGNQLVIITLIVEYTA